MSVLDAEVLIVTVTSASSDSLLGILWLPLSVISVPSVVHRI